MRKGGTPADVAADAMARAGIYRGDPGQVDQFGEAANAAATARKGMRQQAARENKIIRQDEAFARDSRRPGTNQNPIIADDLLPGDSLKIRATPFKVRELEFGDNGGGVGVKRRPNSEKTPWDGHWPRASQPMRSGLLDQARFSINRSTQRTVLGWCC